ncbi:hypothetical protein RCH18_000947 [Flavobacterium sp. PL11]|uniref:hypothetical protein n=1 Tax=Flavobacterium sp. PL11 TaxID=3071717 RepID=UPI002E020AAE|nr:hypothetical protein [Flavobacterium sp. PL11]
MPFYIHENKTSHLAAMAVASLLGGVRPARYNVQRDNSCGMQRGAAPTNNNRI